MNRFGMPLSRVLAVVNDITPNLDVNAYLAAKLGVGHRMVVHWKNETKPIPPKREAEILQLLSELEYDIAHILRETADVTRKWAEICSSSEGVSAVNSHELRAEVDEAKAALELAAMCIERKAAQNG